MLFNLPGTRLTPEAQRFFGSADGLWRRLTHCARFDAVASASPCFGGAPLTLLSKLILGMTLAPKDLQSGLDQREAVRERLRWAS
jgi:hypothetical protein